MSATRRILLFGAAGVAAAALGAAVMVLPHVPAAQAGEITVYKTPWCGCCGAWVTHLRDSGFAVSVEEHDDLTPIKRRHGVPADLESCHTAVVDGYVVEGHVPAADIRGLLAQRPQATGLAVPGMPIGSPGMEQGSNREPYQVMLFGPGGQTSVWSRY